MKIITSKQFSLDYRDLLKGSLMAGLTSGFTIVQQLIDSGNFDKIDWKHTVMAAVGGFIGYLAKNFFTPSKVVAKVQSPENLEVIKDKVEKDLNN